jgi:hypothetical protein
MINHALKVWHGCVFAALAVLLLLITQPAIAGGAASGPGLLSPTPSPGQPAQPVDSNRLDIALDYALNDSIVKSELENIALSAATQGVPGVSIALDLKKAFTLASSNFSDVSFNNILTTFRTSLEVALAPIKATTPGFGPALSTAKLSTAFATAFMYGYFWGR